MFQTHHSVPIISNSSQTMEFAVFAYDKSIVPASKLDNILVPKGNNLEYQLFNPLDGKELTKENRKEFYKQVYENAKNKIYETTDHVITMIKVDDIYFIYVSLDNSMRSNNNSSPLTKRLSNLCAVVNMVKALYSNCVIFFSESCRPSPFIVEGKFEGEMNWLEMRKVIQEKCNLVYISDKRNNEDPSGMSFGLSAFAGHNVTIQNYFGVKICRTGFGSVALGVKVNNKIVWAIHFPLNFKEQGEKNPSFETMINLKKLFTSYPGSICAFGDFNTIPGNIENTIKLAKEDDFDFLLDELTFFGSHYDTIPSPSEYMLISDL